MHVTVIGTGYVGLVTGTCLSDVGNNVCCHDIDERKIGMLRRGEIPIYEPSLAELVRRNVKDERLRFTTDLANAISESDVCFVAVGTPSDQDGSADRRYVTEAVAGIARHMQRPLVIAVKSTVPVGTCAKMRAVVEEQLAARGVSIPFDVVFNPEFLKEGKAVEDFMRPDRIVIGGENEMGLKAMEAIYGPFIRNGHPYIVMDVASAEMTKYAANCMLATRISLMNELAQICDRVGADIMKVRAGIGTDRRIGMDFLYAGVGYGGSCFPKDVKALSRLAVESDCAADILDAVERVNRHQKVMLANRIIARFDGNVRGKRFALWGLAFKADTDDIREAPALAILKRLTDAGAHVCAFDPEAMSNAKRELAGNANVSFADHEYETLSGADALVLATEWRQFRRPDFHKIKASLRQPLIFDGRNQYEPKEMLELGIEYHSVGRARTRTPLQ